MISTIISHCIVWRENCTKLVHKKKGKKDFAKTRRWEKCKNSNVDFINFFLCIEQTRSAGKIYWKFHRDLQTRQRRVSSWNKWNSLIFHRLDWSHKSAFNFSLICILIEWKTRWREMKERSPNTKRRKSFYSHQTLISFQVSLSRNCFHILISLSILFDRVLIWSIFPSLSLFLSTFLFPLSLLCVPA